MGDPDLNQPPFMAVPPTVILVTKLGEFRRNILQWTDKRVGFMNEIINGMQMIKFYAVSVGQHLFVKAQERSTCLKPRFMSGALFCRKRHTLSFKPCQLGRECERRIQTGGFPLDGVHNRFLTSNADTKDPSCLTPVAISSLCLT